MTTTLEHDGAAAEVGATLYGIAWRRRISQAELGRAIGVSQGTMGKKLRGSVPITVAELLTLAAFLEINPASLLPRLDSNQQPSGYPSSQVRPVERWELAA